MEGFVSESMGRAETRGGVEMEWKGQWKSYKGNGATGLEGKRKKQFGNELALSRV